MTYLSVVNFWEYQNADVWKKAKVHPPWFKHYVARDREIDALPLLARLLWYELLAAATRHSNVLEADLNWIWAETRVPTEVIAETLPLLVKGGWLSETETARRSRLPSRKSLEKNLDLREVEVEVEKEGFNKTPRSNGKGDLDHIAALIRNGVLAEIRDLELELDATTNLTDEQRDFLRSLIDA